MCGVWVSHCQHKRINKSDFVACHTPTAAGGDPDCQFGSAGAFRHEGTQENEWTPITPSESTKHCIDGMGIIQAMGSHPAERVEQKALLRHDRGYAGEENRNRAGITLHIGSPNVIRRVDYMLLQVNINNVLLFRKLTVFSEHFACKIE
jgi:hypothetical protein